MTTLIPPKGRPESQVAKSRVVRDGSKSAKMLDLLKRPGGATSKELMKATGWLPHRFAASCPVPWAKKWD